MIATLSHHPEVIRAIVERQIANRRAADARELRAWKRRNRWYRQRGTWRVLLILAAILVLCAAPLLYALLWL